MFKKLIELLLSLFKKDTPAIQPKPTKEKIPPKLIEEPIKKPMIPKYKLSPISEKRLATCHPDIQKVIREAIKYVDFIVVEGYRSEVKQEEYFKKGTSKVRYPNSYHNVSPALAIDIAPWDGKSKIYWSDREKFFKLAKIIKREADSLNIPLDWGYDMWEWDLPHWQLTSYRNR